MKGALLRSRLASRIVNMVSATVVLTGLEAVQFANMGSSELA